MAEFEPVEGGHVFEGKPDGRQSLNVNDEVSRFRTRYRALTDDEKKLHDAIKMKAVELEAMIEQCAGKTPRSPRYASLALTDLESSIMWAVKALTA